MHRYFRRRYKNLDRRSRQYRAFLGTPWRQATSATRLFVADIFPRLLPHRRVVSGRHGELACRSVTCHETGQVSIASARILRIVLEVCLLWQVVRLYGKGQFIECLAYSFRSVDIPGWYQLVHLFFSLSIIRLTWIKFFFLICNCKPRARIKYFLIYLELQI